MINVEKMNQLREDTQTDSSNAFEHRTTKGEASRGEKRIDGIVVFLFHMACRETIDFDKILERKQVNIHLFVTFRGILLIERQLHLDDGHIDRG